MRQNKEQAGTTTWQINLAREKKQAAEVNTLSRRSLWGLLLFILISIAALPLREVNLLEVVSENVRAMLGPPAPATLVTVALAIYCFSATSILLNRLANDEVPTLTWAHLGYRTVFYLFYAVSGALASHFLAVFFIGIILYGIEQVHVWSYGKRAEHQEEGLWGG